MTEAPVDVLEFLEFIVTRYKNPRKAFKVITRFTSEDCSEITLRSLEEAVRKMNCHKFKDDNSKDDVRAPI